jgi:hypothetical protein
MSGQARHNGIRSSRPRHGVARSARGAASAWLAQIAMLAAVGLLAGAAHASAAAGEAPRWKIVSSTSPTNLAPNSPRDEVQDVAIDATGGTFKLSVSSRGCEEGVPSATEPIAATATAAEVQSALEALSCPVGSGGVTVTGGAGAAGPYVVSFVGEHGNRPVPRMKADAASLTGGAATATVTEAVRGAYPPYMTVTAINVGGAATDGSTVTLEGTLPSSLAATSVSGYDAYASPFAGSGEGAAPLTCAALPTLSCSYSGIVDPGDMLVMRIDLDVGESAAANVSRATVSGGGAPEASRDTVNAISSTPAPFGPVPGSLLAAASTDQAGAHGNITEAFTMATDEPDAVPVDAKDLRFDLPPGFAGATVGLPRCTMGRVLRLEREPDACPADTMVGMASLTINTQAGAGGGDFALVTPVYNIAPTPGEAAAFGINALVLPVRLDVSILSNGNYALRVAVPDMNESAAALSAVVTIWGVPADHSGPGGNGETTVFGQSFGGPNTGETRSALLTNPQQCGEALAARMSADPWTSPGAFVFSGPVPMGVFAGCDQLEFEPTFSMLADNLEAGVPSGYTLELRVPQNDEPSGLATPDVKSVKLKLPAGVVVSPSTASGLAACSSSQFYGDQHGTQEPAPPAGCPRASQIGTAEAETPALALPLHGEVFLGEPECDPCTPQDAGTGRMIRLFVQLVAEGESPIVVKLEGRSTIDQLSGQITITFADQPQLPFRMLRLALADGSRAALANPRACGPLTTAIDVTPWSAPFSADSVTGFGFEVNQQCFGAQFDPGFLAGTTSIQAGGYSPFTVSITRGDHDQFLGGLELQLAPGLLGKLASVPLCEEPQAADGTCNGESLIGHLQILAGPGAMPMAIVGGKVFLTSGYEGAPFGLSIVIPALAGPYTLAGTTGAGTVVVRASVGINANDASIVIKSDPLPAVLDGIPLQLRAVDMTIDRNQFMFDPTNCARLAISGSLSSVDGSRSAVATPFEVANCAALPFKPALSAWTQAKTSKADGASLHIHLVSGSGQANIAKLRVDLPKQLPARLTTLQQACRAAVFAANPASCPSASVVGSASVRTPVLKGVLSGPAYLISHGGAAFPDLEMVLQGDGVALVLDGSTYIRQGITSSTFNAVPDVPISSFDLALPEGPHSALATSLPRKSRRSLCGRSLAMPTRITGQNGAVIEQARKVSVAGCPKRRNAKRVRRRRKAPHRRG